MHKIFVSIK